MHSDRSLWRIVKLAVIAVPVASATSWSILSLTVRLEQLSARPESAGASGLDLLYAAALLVTLVAVTAVTATLVVAIYDRELVQPLRRLLHWRSAGVAAAALAIESVAAWVTTDILPRGYAMASPLAAQLLYGSGLVWLWLAAWLSAALLVTRASSGTRAGTVGELQLLLRLEGRNWIVPVTVWSLLGVLLAQGVPSALGYLAWYGPAWFRPAPLALQLIALVRELLLSVWVLPAAAVLVRRAQQRAA